MKLPKRQLAELKHETEQYVEALKVLSEQNHEAMRDLNYDESTFQEAWNQRLQKLYPCR